MIKQLFYSCRFATCVCVWAACDSALFTGCDVSLIIQHNCWSLLPTNLLEKTKHNLLILESFGMGLWVVSRSLIYSVIWMQTQYFSETAVIKVYCPPTCFQSTSVIRDLIKTKRLFGENADIWSTNVMLHVMSNSEQNKIKIIRSHNKQSTEDIRMLQYKKGFV